MVFNYINVINVIIFVILMVPNIIYGIKNKDAVNLCNSASLNIIEQIGRYGSMTFLILPVGVWRFTLTDNFLFIYIFINSLLLLAYYVFWYYYGKKRTLYKALALAIIPFVLFLLDGIMLYHLFLIMSSVLFAVGHISITYINNKQL